MFFNKILPSTKCKALSNLNVLKNGKERAIACVTVPHKIGVLADLKTNKAKALKKYQYYKKLKLC